MPRKKTVVLGQQVYQLPGYGPHAKVTIDYDVEKPPPFFQPGAGVVIVGEHLCDPGSRLSSLFQVVPPVPAEPERGPSLDEIRAFQERHEGKVKKPLTSEDVAREAGFPAAALSFENLSGIAAGMPPVAAEDSLVE